MNDRMQKSEYLFREIGNIHDRWVVEALAYKPRRSTVPRVLMIAASIALTASLLVASLIVGMKQNSHTAGNTANGEDTPNFTHSLDALLLDCKTNPNASYTVLSSSAELDYFSSEVRVAWQYADSSAVYVSRALSKSQTQRLEKGIQNSTNAVTAEQPSCKICILYGDGRVVSPYLHPSIGNTGESELFDYNIEIIPDADFSSCLSEILY